MGKVAQERKDSQLQEPYGTACSRLRKMLLFKYVAMCGENKCFRCGGYITNIRDFSIDHKIAWLDSANPIDSFFLLDNVAFSHLRCNAASRRAASLKVRPRNHGRTLYGRGCRCDICMEANRKHRCSSSVKRSQKIKAKAAKNVGEFEGHIVVKDT